MHVEGPEKNSQGKQKKHWCILSIYNPTDLTGFSISSARSLNQNCGLG